MSLDLADYETMAKDAVRHFWATRAEARQKQSESGKNDQGERSGVTAGKNMNGFVGLVERIVRGNGPDNAKICLKRSVLTLPGFFRLTKIWDRLVVNEGRLVTAIEFKSQVGPSFGNNFNNRTEEAIGTAVDLRTACREGALGDNPLPFLGWLMLVEDCDKSRSPVRAGSRHFPVFPEFNDTSYAQRYKILCRKLVQEQLYTTATLLLSPRTAIDTGSYSELSGLTSLKTFVSTLAGHLAAEAARVR